MIVVKIKKQKAQTSLLKRKLQFENYENCLDAAELEKRQKLS